MMEGLCYVWGGHMYMLCMGGHMYMYMLCKGGHVYMLFMEGHMYILCMGGPHLHVMYGGIYLMPCMY